jgi:hypothetical protein
LLRDLVHVERRAAAWDLHPEPIFWKHDSAYKAGGCVFDCPDCGPDWKVVAREFRGGGVGLRCAGCDSVSTRRLLPLTPEGLAPAAQMVASWLAGAR